jgi:flagellar motor switch protein FliG
MADMAEVPQTGPQTTQLSKPEKVAVLLLTLERSRAADLLRRLDEHQLGELERAATRLTSVDREVVSGIVAEFEAAIARGHGPNPSEIATLIQQTRPSPAMAEDDDAASRAPVVWDLIADQTDDRIKALLLQEHLQVAAFVLSRLPAARAAKIIEKFAVNVRSALLSRMLTMRAVAPAAEALIVDALVRSLQQSHAQQDHSAAYTGVADILNRLRKADVDESLTLLDEIYPQRVVELRKRLFSFEDLLKLEAKAVALIFDPLPAERVILALKGSSPQLQSVVLASLTSRARRMAEAELANPEMPADAEIDAARRGIVERVLDMVARNEIALSMAAPAPRA